MKTLLYPISIILLIVFSVANIAFAGTTGKVVGKVVDEKREPLIGVNVVVKGTTRGAVTDPDGIYTIIGVPEGSYTIQARQIGYRTMEVTDVKVMADQTTALDFTLVSSAVEVGVFTVTANQTLVNKNVTSATQTMNKEKIEQIPAAKTVQDVIKIQAGVVKQGNSYFLRGGRANEVQYVVDGVPVNNLMGNSGELVGTSSTNKDLSSLYSGMASGAIGTGGGLQVSSNAIEDVSVQSSGFDADFGNAQSGIVNITTKSGKEDLSATLQYRTDKISNTNQNEVYNSFTLGGPEPISKYLLPGLGVKLPGSITFFMSTDINRSDGTNTYSHNEFFHPVGRKIELNGFLGGIMNGLGFKFYDNQSNSFTFSSKIRYDINRYDNITYSYNASLASSHSFVNSWKYFADSSALGANFSGQHVLAWSHFFGEKSFMKLNIGKVEKHEGNDVAGLTPDQYSPIITGRDPNSDGFYDLGMSQRWYSSLTRDWSLRFDYNSQVHPLHLFKTGVEFHYEEIQSTEIQNPTVSDKDSLGDVIYPPFPEYMGRNRGLYPGYGQYRWVINNYPHRGAFYLQDNIEFSGLTLHLGIRYDYIDLGRQVFYNDFWEAWVTAVNPVGTDPSARLQPQWVLNQGTDEKGQLRDGRFLSDGRRLWYYLTHGYFSPRLAINYPVTERIAFYFNYGHFLQYPERDQYFRDAYVTGTDTWVGNPDLKPQRTIAYEAGFDDQFTDEMAFKIRAFYKDIFDYVTNVPRLGISLYRNLDYSSVRGFEVSFDQAMTGNFWTTLNYSYQIAKGRSSNTNSAIFKPDFQLPRETRLDFDQTHTINVFATYKVGAKEEGQLFGLPFVNNYGISVTWSYGSGFPYTPYTQSRNNIQDQYLNNNNTRPHTSTVNLSVYKGFMLFQKINAVVTLDVTNLWNRRNVATGDRNSGFNTVDGRPLQFGDYDPSSATKYIYAWDQMGSLVPPYVFDAPRQILLGFKFNWN